MRRRPRAMSVDTWAVGAGASDASASSACSTSSRRIELDLRDLVVEVEVDTKPRLRGVQRRLHRSERAAHCLGNLVKLQTSVVAEHQRDALTSRELLDRG